MINQSGWAGSSRYLIFLIFVFWSGAAFTQSTPIEAQKLKSQADNIEDQGAQAIDDGDISRGMDLMVHAVALDPTPIRHMMYGSMLFGNGVEIFKGSDQHLGQEVLRQAETQLLQAIQGFNPNRDQVYLSQCYFMLGDMYRNAFGDKSKAKAYYKRSVDLNDNPEARDALNRLSS